MQCSVILQRNFVYRIGPDSSTNDNLPCVLWPKFTRRASSAVTWGEVMGAAALGVTHLSY